MDGRVIVITAALAHQLAEPADYACLRCGTVLRSRRLTVVDGDWLRLLCPSCIEVPAPAYERAAEDH